MQRYTDGCSFCSWLREEKHLNQKDWKYVIFSSRRFGELTLLDKCYMYIPTVEPHGLKVWSGSELFLLRLPLVLKLLLPLLPQL